MGGMSARVRSVFELVRLGEVFTITESVDDARAQLQ